MRTEPMFSLCLIIPGLRVISVLKLIVPRELEWANMLVRSHSPSFIYRLRGLPIPDEQMNAIYTREKRKHGTYLLLSAIVFG